MNTRVKNFRDIPGSVFGADDAQELQERPAPDPLVNDKELAVCHGYNYEYGDVPDEDDYDGSTLLNEKTNDCMPHRIHEPELRQFTNQVFLRIGVFDIERTQIDT